MGVAAIAASAQNMYDALNYSDVNYYGTARSIALGNAMTALGGDLGSITINPAGSAVAGYSQIAVTPNLSISSTAASYSPYAYGDPTSRTTSSQSRFTLPNLGVTLDWQTGRSYGLKSFTLGIVTSGTNLYSEKMSAGGTQEYTSMMGAMAYAADGIHYSYLQNYNSAYGSWTDVLAYNSGMISVINSDGNSYIGTTELLYEDGQMGIGGPLYQDCYRLRTGSRNDLVFNFAGNVSDRFYFGVNLGVPYLSYSESVNQYEEAVSPSDFEIVYDDDLAYHFSNARQRYALDVAGTGIYAKVGAIFLPVDGLRIGAAIQTPTLMTITERYKWDAICNFTEYNGSLNETPDGEYTYNLTTPFVFNLGAAYTFGDFALVSADFERTNHKRMRFSDYSDYYDGTDSWAAQNNEIWNYAGATNIVRVGAEVKVLPGFALRGGYNFKQYRCSEYTETTNSFAFGLGYSSNGSFFADAALRSTLYPESWYYPYENYISTDSPEVNVRRTLTDIVLTVGWRF